MLNGTIQCMSLPCNYCCTNATAMPLSWHCHTIAGLLSDGGSKKYLADAGWNSSNLWKALKLPGGMGL